MHRCPSLDRKILNECFRLLAPPHPHIQVDVLFFYMNLWDIICGKECIPFLNDPLHKFVGLNFGSVYVKFGGWAFAKHRCAQDEGTEKCAGLSYTSACLSCLLSFRGVAHLKISIVIHGVNRCLWCRTLGLNRCLWCRTLGLNVVHDMVQTYETIKDMINT
jgi:hypothetical protein